MNSPSTFPFLAAAYLGLALVAGCKQQPAQAVEPSPAAAAAQTAVATAAAPPAEPRATPECAAPIGPSPETATMVGAQKATSSGSQLTFADNGADGLILGVLGPANEDSGANILAIRKYVAFFKAEKVDAIVVPGDSGEVADGISRVLREVASAKVPVFVLAGNRECQADYTRGVTLAQKDFSNIVDMNRVRIVQFPDGTLISLPGYFNPEFMACEQGCRYFRSTVDEVISAAKVAKTPPILLAHATPHGEGSQALDYTKDGNVGDPDINRALQEGNLAFGVFSNIKEAGGRATDSAGTTPVKAGVPAKSLYLNPGPADTTRWDMNDGTKSYGMAAVLTLRAGQGTWKSFRAKAPTPAEKKQAKALDPPPRAEAEESDEPAPSPGKPAAP